MTFSQYAADAREREEADRQVARAELDRDWREAEVEEPDRWGRDADYNWPRGYGGAPW